MTRKGWLLFTAISVFWGIPYLFIKIVVRELDPTVVVFARVGIATAVLVPIAVLHKMLQPLCRRWLVITALSLIQITGPFLLISYGELHIASSFTSLLIATEPLLVALFAWHFDHSEQVGGMRLIGLLIGILGVVMLLGFNISGDEQKLLGAAFVLLAAAGYAVGALFIKRPIIATLPPLGVVAAECAIATIVLAPIAVTRLPKQIPNLETLVSLLVLGLICTALAYLTLFALIAEVGASRGIVFTYINPAVSVLLGVTFLSESFNIAMMAGFLLIIIGSCMSTSNILLLLVPLVRTRFQRQANRDIGTIHRDVP
jgi:drug/metabolite transporter (DMT)-like permease